MIGIAVAVAVPLIYAGASAFAPKCSFHEFYLPYSQENTETWVEISQIILIGTVKDVEVELVEQIGHAEDPISGFGISRIPYKFVRIEVDEYLMDKTGRNAKEITVKTWANGCIDASGNFSPIERADYVTYTAGEKSLLMIPDQSEDGTLVQGLYTYKFDITSRNGIEIVKSNQAANIAEMKLSDLVAEIRAAINKSDEGDEDS